MFMHMPIIIYVTYRRESVGMGVNIIYLVIECLFSCLDTEPTRFDYHFSFLLKFRTVQLTVEVPNL